MSIPCAEWLCNRYSTGGLKQPFEIWTEVPYFDRSIDMIGHAFGTVDEFKHPLIVAVELKLNLSWQVLMQADLTRNFATWSWAAIASQPTWKSYERAVHLGIGVVRLKQGAEAEVLVEPKGPMPSRSGHDDIVRHLHTTKPGGIAGKPNQLGEGRAVETWARVVEYRKKRPRATWKEIASAIEHPYQNAKELKASMQRVAHKRRLGVRV